mgnify:FL=1
MGKEIIEEFFDFFNSLLIGYSSEDADNDISSILSSESMMEALTLKLNDTMKQYKNEISQEIIADKNITIDCGSERLTGWHIQPRGQKYTWYGSEIPNTSCIKYGCCYDVTQTANIKLSAINETTTEDHIQLWTDVRQTMTHELAATIGESSQDLVAMDRALNKVEHVSINKIKEILENASKTFVGAGQNIEITSEAPLMCKNSCDAQPSAGTVTQELNVEIIVNNIITTITESVTKAYIEMTSDTSTEMSNIDMNKIYIFAVLSCILITIIYIICFIIAYLLFTFLAKRPPPNEMITHAIAITLIIIIYMFYSMILCLLRSGGGIGAVFCMF